MLNDLNPYPAYKDSKLPWLGLIPTHWDVRRNGRLFAQRNDTGFAELPILEVSLKTGVKIRDMDAGRKQVMSDRDAYKRAAKGDIAYNMMRMWQGAVGVAPANGLVSPAYVVARPLAGVEPRYYAYLFRTAIYMDEVDKFSRGIVKDRNRLYWDQFKQMPSAFPPEIEQTKIADFLDANAVVVRRLLLNKRGLIKLLNEQKRAVITQAVTRGLEPSVKLKTTGLSWASDVPEHWTTGRVKTEFHNFNTRRVPLNGTDREKMTQRMYDYYGASGVIDKVDKYLFDDDLLLIAEDGANLVLRNLPLAIIARGKFWVNNHAHILKPKSGSLEYFAALMECIDYTPWITGAAQPKLTMDRLMAIRIPVPPEPEQTAISLWLNESTKELNTAIVKGKQEIELIREYRARLIADVVTGKVDVRHLAPAMVEPAALEPLDDEMDTESDDLNDASPEEVEVAHQ